MVEIGSGAVFLQKGRTEDHRKKERGYTIMQQNMMGQNIIITEPSSNLRALGRNALTGKWKLAVITVILYSLCMEVPPAVLDALFGVNMGDIYISSGGYGYNVGADTYSVLYNNIPEYSCSSGRSSW